MNRRVYRQSPAVAVFGLIFAAAGLGFFIFAVRAYINGDPISMRVNGNAPRPATDNERFFFMLFPLIHFSVGAGILLYWKNWSLVTEDEGIIGTGISGTECFRCTWDQITSVSKQFRRSQPYYVIQASDQSMKFYGTKASYRDLLAEIRTRRPDLHMPY